MAKLRPTYAFVKRLEVLSSGRLHFKDSVKVVAITYNTHGSSSNGIRSAGAIIIDNIIIYAII